MSKATGRGAYSEAALLAALRRYAGVRPGPTREMLAEAAGGMAGNTLRKMLARLIAAGRVAAVGNTRGRLLVLDDGAIVYPAAWASGPIDGESATEAASPPSDVRRDLPCKAAFGRGADPETVARFFAGPGRRGARILYAHGSSLAGLEAGDAVRRAVAAGRATPVQRRAEDGELDYIAIRR